MPDPPKFTEAIKMTLDQFTEHLSKNTSSIFSPTPPREPTPPKDQTPPRDKSKGKSIATEDPIKDIMAFMEEGGSAPKISSLKSFVIPEEPLSQEKVMAHLKEMKRLANLKVEKVKADQLPITKISYVVNLNKEATMKITKGDNPLNLIVHPNFRLKTLGFSEWLEAKKLGLPPPLALATFRMTTEDKKRKRKRTEILKEVFVTKNITVDGMHRNLISFPGVVLIEGLVINKPESGIFFINRNIDIAFQRENVFKSKTSPRKSKNYLKIYSSVGMDNSLIVMEEITPHDKSGNIAPNGLTVLPNGGIISNQNAYLQANMTRDNTKSVDGEIVCDRNAIQLTTDSYLHLVFGGSYLDRAMPGIVVVVLSIAGSGYQQKDRKPSQNDKTEHEMEKTVKNQANGMLRDCQGGNWSVVRWGEGLRVMVCLWEQWSSPCGVKLFGDCQDQSSIVYVVIARQPTGRSLGDISFILNLMDGLVFDTSKEDEWVWNIESSSIFSVSSLSSLIQKKMLVTVVDSPKSVWNSWVPRKVNVCAWRVAMDRLPTRENLLRRGLINLDSSSCLFCGSDVESKEHCFLSCPKIKIIWLKIWSWWKVSPLFNPSLDDILHGISCLHSNKRKAKLFHAICLGCIWSVWAWRNRILHASSDEEKAYALREDIFPRFKDCCFYGLRIGLQRFVFRGQIGFFALMSFQKLRLSLFWCFLCCGF
ncbi:RNA-directed DNA polymerase, eukaryota, reverse transcriptase zinc-binding domain protein [Tanacetum coccineum]